MTSPHDTAESYDADVDAALRKLHSEVLDESVPPTLLGAAKRLDTLRQQYRQSWRYGAVAASVLLSFGAGWVASGQFQSNQQGRGSLSQASFDKEFVRQASFAYAVYVPEKRHPVEVAATEQEHLVQWLSKRLGKPLKVPQLDAQGFELVGGRLLPGESGARAQFMFQNQQSQRVTLYIGALEKVADRAALQATQAAQFRFEPNGAVPSFYWADQGFGYALSGQVDKTTLMALSTLVYSQIR
jgi:anti-sigma factor RsiW